MSFLLIPTEIDIKRLPDDLKYCLTKKISAGKGPIYIKITGSCHDERKGLRKVI